ncbi:MAG TPA: hypothetical protein VEY06_11350 [Flavisolibacter sp.]|nr:hypothetical protein [Flavisolibacter sp.]
MTTLKNVMLINALSSGATGLLLVIFSGYTAELFGVTGQLPFVAVGILLLLFAVFVFAHSRRNPLSKAWIRVIIAIDILWVIESLVIVFPKMFGFSALGYMLIVAVALWVTVMAVLQAKGLKQLLRTH